jgi:3-deoxy-manno-octulosonate cytidylyltransferase (CMP-KDO synthetase)
MNYIAIIPARYASTRFPGKPLIDIDGKTMISRVYEQAKKAFETVVVATDDQRIYDHVKSFDGNVVMTSILHKSGTDRCSEAIKIWEHLSSLNYDVIVNVQGDEPFIQPEVLEIIKETMSNEGVQIATLIKTFSNNELIKNVNHTKVIKTVNNKAIYFSRSIIPHISGRMEEDWSNVHNYYKHIGIYAYKKDILHKITQLPNSTLELAESLEQNRWIENEIPVTLIETKIETLSIDTAEDLKNIYKYI